MSEKRFLTPATLSPPFGYSHVVEAPAGSIVYISGQVAVDGDDRLGGEGGFAAQPRQVFETLTHALEAAEATWSDVVKLDYFPRDVGQIGAVRSIRDEFVDTANPPASTLVEVSSLFSPDVLVEIQAIAVKA